MIQKFGLQTAIKTHKKIEDRTFEQRIKKSEDKINYYNREILLMGIFVNGITLNN
jgi:hypothetical protein